LIHAGNTDLHFSILVGFESVLFVPFKDSLQSEGLLGGPLRRDDSTCTELLGRGLFSFSCGGNAAALVATSSSAKFPVSGDASWIRDPLPVHFLFFVFFGIRS
jgi:hypothetical protein